MASYTIRAKLKPDGRLELLDPLPDDFDYDQEITLTVGEYITTNVYGMTVVVDPVNGIVRPLETPDIAEDEEFFGMWEDRTDITDSGQWVHDLRRRPQRKTPPQWPDRPE